MVEGDWMVDRMGIVVSWLGEKPISTLEGGVLQMPYVVVSPHFRGKNSKTDCG